MFFRGDKQRTMTMTLEGALGPNGRLDEADAMPMAAPEAVCVDGAGELLASSGSNVFRIRQWGKTPELWRSFDAPVSALAASEGGRIAVGLSGGRIVVCDASGEALSGWTPARARARSLIVCFCRRTNWPWSITATGRRSRSFRLRLGTRSRGDK